MGTAVESALSIDLILENIFSYLPKSAIETCRCVSTRWFHMAGKTLNHRDERTIEDPGQISILRQTIRQNPFIRYRFHSLVLQLEDIHCNSCSTELLALFQEGRPMLDTLVVEKYDSSFENYQRIINLACSTLEKLDIAMLREVGPFLKVYYPLFPIYDSLETRSPMILPKLKILGYICFDKPGGTLLSNVVAACPNLTSLTIGNMLEENPNIFHHLRLPKLRYLYLQMLGLSDEEPMIRPQGLQAPQIRCLMNMQLNLKRLIIINVHPNVPESLFRDWLQTLSTTLDFLILRSVSADPAMSDTGFTQPTKDQLKLPVPFPLQLPNLTEALICKPFIRNIADVLKCSSKLTKLCLPFLRDVNWNMIMPNVIRPHENLKLLEVHWIPNNVFLKLINSFINLASLTLHDCSAEGLLETVFSKLTTLNGLVLESGYTIKSVITDDKLTGILAGSQSRTRPCIGNLRNLKILCLNNGDLISKKSIHFGLAYLPDLCILALAMKTKKVKPEFKQPLENIGFQHIQMKNMGNKIAKGLDNYDYFVKQTTEFWENETSEEFISRHVRTASSGLGYVISQVWI